MSTGFRAGTIGTVFRLAYQHPYRDNALFPRAKVYDSSDVSIATISLGQVVGVEGFYTGNWIASVAAGLYNVVITPYTDAGFTAVSDSDGNVSEIIQVESSASSASFAGVMGGITLDDIKLIAEEVWKYLLQGRKAGEVLVSRSEFNPEIETVKAHTVNLDEVVIPTVDLKPILADLSLVDEKITRLGKGQTKISAQVSKIEMPKTDLTPVLEGLAKIEAKDYVGEVRDILQDLVSRVEVVQNLIPDDRFEEILVGLGELKADATEEEQLKSIKAALVGIENLLNDVPEATSAPILALIGEVEASVVLKFKEQSKIFAESVDEQKKDQTKASIFLDELKKDIALLYNMLDLAHKKGQDRELIGFTHTSKLFSDFVAMWKREHKPKDQFMQ